MNVLIISNLILLLILLSTYLYIRNIMSKQLFYNVLFLDVLLYFISPVLVSILNIIIDIYLDLNELFFRTAFIPLVIPFCRVAFKLIIFIKAFKLYRTYENSISDKLIELLTSINIYVNREKITIDLRKFKSCIYCDVYIKVPNIKDKDKHKYELKQELEDTFRNIKFKIIFDVKFKYNKG